MGQITVLGTSAVRRFCENRKKIINKALPPGNAWEVFSEAPNAARRDHSRGCTEGFSRNMTISDSPRMFVKRPWLLVGTVDSS